MTATNSCTFAVQHPENRQLDCSCSKHNYTSAGRAGSGVRPNDPCSEPASQVSWHSLLQVPPCDGSTCSLHAVTCGSKPHPPGPAVVSCVLSLPASEGAPAGLSSRCCTPNLQTRLPCVLTRRQSPQRSRCLTSQSHTRFVSCCCCPWHAVVAWLLLLAPYCLFGLFELAMQQQQHHHAMRWIRGS